MVKIFELTSDKNNWVCGAWWKQKHKGIVNSSCFDQQHLKHHLHLDCLSVNGSVWVDIIAKILTPFHTEDNWQTWWSYNDQYQAMLVWPPSVRSRVRPWGAQQNILTLSGLILPPQTRVEPLSTKSGICDQFSCIITHLPWVYIVSEHKLLAVNPPVTRQITAC